jgi:endo-1,4-beta-xylanase
MNVKSLTIVTGVVILVSIIAFSMGCQNQPTGPEADFRSDMGGRFRISSNQTGSHGGYFYSFWTDGGGSVNMELGTAGNYSVEWSNCGNFVCGKGWNPGGARNITWSGSANGAQFFGVYGWLQNPLVEYYIPRSGGSSRGTYQADGTTYTLGTEQRVNQPSIEGTATFTQYFCGGGGGESVNIGEHLDGWRSLGMSVGSHNYQIVAVEGWGGSSGNANVTLADFTTTTTNGGSTTTTVASGGPSPEHPYDYPHMTSSTTTSGWWGGGFWWGGGTTTTSAYTTTTVVSTTTTSGSSWWGAWW